MAEHSKMAVEIDNAVIEAASNRGLRGLTREERLALIDQKLSGVREAICKMCCQLPDCYESLKLE